jgi:hypothetical protein
MLRKRRYRDIVGLQPRQHDRTRMLGYLFRRPSFGYSHTVLVFIAGRESPAGARKGAVMSRIVFHSPSGEARVCGAERARASCITRQLFALCIGYDGLNDDPIRRILPADFPQAKSQARVSLEGYGHDDVAFIVDGTHIPLLDAQINTALVAGSPVIGFLARLHAQCEMHAFVEGPHRIWLANLIALGVNDSILRVFPEDADYHSGWNAVIGLLQRRNDEPVVLSYSVTSTFPNPHIGRKTSLKEEEAFSLLARTVQWERAMRDIRCMPGLRWEPDTFFTQRFGPGAWDAFSLRDYAERTFPRARAGNDISRSN